MGKFIKVTHTDGREVHIAKTSVYLVGVHSDGQTVVGYGPDSGLMSVNETMGEVLAMLEAD